MNLISKQSFQRAYRDACLEIIPFIDDPNLLMSLSVHNPEYHDGIGGFRRYLELSFRRYWEALRLGEAFLTDQTSIEEIAITDIGGFFGALPLAFAKMGARVNMVEATSLYGDGFSPLYDHLQNSGVEIIDQDATTEDLAIERADFVFCMAVIEHLADSPRKLLSNFREAGGEKSVYFLDVPNICYAPRRLGMLCGKSPLPPIEALFESKSPYTGHHREYSRSELETVLKLSEMKRIEIKAINYSMEGRSLWKRVIFQKCMEAVLPDWCETYIVVMGR